MTRPSPYDWFGEETRRRKRVRTLFVTVTAAVAVSVALLVALPFVLRTLELAW